MFRKRYSYKIFTDDLSKWHEINERAENIYEQYIKRDHVFEIKEEGEYVFITETDTYQSEEEYNSTKEKLDESTEHFLLVAEFLPMIQSEVKEEDL